MKFVGHSHPIHDAVAKATGRAVYAGDMSLPGMLHLAVLFSPIPHGIVKAIDVSAALALPGVVDVIHCFNTTQNLFNRFRFMVGDEPPAQERVFNQHVRFVGDRIGCVIAERPDIARKAVKLIKVDYAVLPFCTDAQQARTTGIIDDIHDAGAVYGDFVYEHGEPPSPDADGVVTATTSSLSRVNHVTMEPHACVAAYDKGMDELTVWSPNQSVYGVRTVLGDLFEIPYHKIRVVKTTMGGSFGAKQEWMLEPVAAAAALRTGRPVKLVFNRAEAMVSTISRCPLRAAVTSRVTKDGRFSSFDLDVTVDAGAYLGNSYVYAMTISNKLHRVYRMPHVHYAARAVCTNAPVSGAFRGWGSPELYLMLEHNINMAARRIGMDPVELRLRNVAMPGDHDPKYERDVGAIRIKECLERGRKLFNWDRLKKEDRVFNRLSDRYRRGVGVACGGHANGYYPKRQDFAAADMRLTESGSVQANITLHDHGCGTVTALKMIIAEELCIPLDMVLLKEGDTAVTPMDVGCFASRTTYVLGGAALACARKLRSLVIQRVAMLENAAVDDLYFEDDVVRSRADPTLGYTYAQVAVSSLRKLQMEVCVRHEAASDSNPSVTGAHFAHVEVDTYTGMVRLLDYLAVHDIGQVINREISTAQVQGAVLMGAGAALSEHSDMKASGQSTSSLKDYHVVNAFDAPSVRVEFVEDGQTGGPFGAKSIGEVSHVPVAPALVGAVNEALQSELCDLPLKPDRIVALMQQRTAA